MSCHFSLLNQANVNEFTKKRDFRQSIFGTPVIILLIIGGVVLGRGVWHAFSKERQSGQDLSLAQKQETDLEARSSYLTASIVSLNTAEGIEGEIRNKFRMAKEGEHLVVIVDDESKNEASQPTPPETFWAKLKSFFEGL